MVILKIIKQATVYESLVFCISCPLKQKGMFPRMVSKFDHICWCYTTSLLLYNPGCPSNMVAPIPCACVDGDGISHNRTCDMKKSQYSECFFNYYYFFFITMSLTD